MPEYVSNYPTSLSYPIASDPVNVHGDFKVLVDALNNILPPLGMTSVASPVRNASFSLTLPAGTPVFISGSTTHSGKIKPLVQRYDPSSPDHNPNFPILGLLQSDMLPASNTNPDVGDGIAVVSGIIQMNTTIFGNALSGEKIYIDNTGTLVAGRPVTGPGRYVGVLAIKETKPNGGMIVVQTKGNGTWGALKDGLS